MQLVQPLVLQVNALRRAGFGCERANCPAPAPFVGGMLRACFERLYRDCTPRSKRSGRRERACRLGKAAALRAVAPGASSRSTLLVASPNRLEKTRTSPGKGLCAFYTQSQQPQARPRRRPPPPPPRASANSQHDQHTPRSSAHQCRRSQHLHSPPSRHPHPPRYRRSSSTRSPLPLLSAPTSLNLLNSSWEGPLTRP